MLSLLNLAQTDVPLWKLLLSGIPHDAGAVVVYVLLGVFIYFIWKGNRKRTE